MYQLVLTTNDGIDDLAVEEFREVAQREELRFDSVEQEPFGSGGHIRIWTDEAIERLLPAVRTMRSIHHVIQYIDQFELSDEPMTQIEERLYETDFPGVAGADTFRITTKRYGEHDFTSIDVQRAAGAGVDRHYETIVDLEDYDVDIRVDVRDDTCLVGPQHTHTALTKRHPRNYNQTASLKANVAWAMLRLAHIGEHEPSTLYDPFCGAGTILIEAADCFPAVEVTGSDIRDNAVEGARHNAKMAGFGSRITTRSLDARELDEELAPGFADLIVTNPPFGMRLKAGMDFTDFYADILEQFSYVLGEEGRVVLLVLKRSAFRHEMGNIDDLYIRHVRIVETGGLYPGIYVLQKK